MKTIQYILIVVVFGLVGWFANTAWHLPRESSPIAQIKPHPLEKYTIENLSKISVEMSQIEIGQQLTGPDHQYCVKGCSSYKFKMSFDPTLSGGERKVVSGIINIPEGKGPFPLIVLLRGFVPTEGYFMGEGTQPAGNFFAKNGYITIAPDFFGYGESDQQAGSTFESRFQTWTTTLTLIKSVNAIKDWDGKNLFIWGHSNGGQIALTILEITQGTYPTVLWAPVSKPFPYSILYFTDSPGDYGKSLRRGLAAFEEDYDTDHFSIHKYWDRIKAPVELDQGSADENVPQAWSDLLNSTLKDIGTDIKYIVYPENDHNMRPNWNQVAANNLTFFGKNLK